MGGGKFVARNFVLVIKGLKNNSVFKKISIKIQLLNGDPKISSISTPQLMPTLRQKVTFKILNYCDR